MKATASLLCMVLCLWLVPLFPTSVSARSIDADPIATSFIYPVGNPLAPPTWNPHNGNGYFLTQGFNDSCDPGLGQGYYLYGLYYCGHTGVDLATQSSSSTVHATAAGVVTEAGLNGGYGVMARIRHTLPNGTLVYSQYQHMQYGSLLVSAGDVVQQGQALGLVGATGFATGVHLHFEIKVDDTDGPGYTFGNQAEIAPYFDPLAYVAAHALQPSVLVTPTGHAIPEWPAEANVVLHRFLAQYKHFVVANVLNGLYVRSGPGKKFHALGIALRGAKLGFLKRQGDWLYVALPENVRGWVSRNWVTGYQAWDVPWPPKGPVAIVSADGLNIHTIPGQTHPVMGICFQGEVVSLGSTTSHWTEVHTREGVRGWVVTRYLLSSRVSTARGGGGPTLTILADVLHVRSGPGTQFSVVGSVFRNTRMPVMRVTPALGCRRPAGRHDWLGSAALYDSGGDRKTYRKAEQQVRGFPLCPGLCPKCECAYRARSTPEGRGSRSDQYKGAGAQADTPLGGDRFTSDHD